MLTQRIDLERSRKGGRGNMARITELNLELSLLKLDDLNDPTAARKEVEAALQASPDNPAALGALARLHLKANDFAAYSSARVREAKALTGRPEAVEALLDAGRVYREQLNDPAKARDASRRRCARPPTAPRRSTRWRRCSPRRRTGTRRAACSPGSSRSPATQTRAPRC